VTVNVRYLPYRIDGSSSQQLRAAMDAHGLEDHGTPVDAYTHWHVRWEYRWDGGTPCQITSTDVTVTIGVILPAWNPPKDASAELQTSWNEYIASVLTHERGHEIVAERVGRQVEKFLKQLEPYSSCEALEGAANAGGDRLVEEGNKANLAYDRRTQHGLTQGARFP
jgi:predicted secreted Zn-dependent protease